MQGNHRPKLPIKVFKRVLKQTGNRKLALTEALLSLENVYNSDFITDIIQPWEVPCKTTIYPIHLIIHTTKGLNDIFY